MILYAVVVLGWTVAHRLVGDRFWALALINAFAVYLFTPLPLAVLLALLARRRAVWIALALTALLFVILYGAALVPPAPAVHAEPGTPALTVMTYNVLYTVGNAEPVADSISRAEPDLIAFQEFDFLRAQALEQMIGERYPYRTPIYPNVCYTMVAIWSRHPILRIEEIDHDVICRLQSVVIDFGGRPVRVINAHGWPYTGLDRRSVERSFQWRQEQIDLILNLIKGQPEPLLLLGDLNSTPMSEVYETLSAHYTDAFTEAGWGLGHTWPATGGHVRGIPYPARLVRIDYVFHSAEWRAEEAWVGQWDGFSDHLPVIARLRLASTK